MLSVRLDAARRQAEQDSGQAMSDRAAAERERDAARTAQREGRERLFDARVAEARAGRFSRRVGQRFGTLTALREAVTLARELDKPPETFALLRNLAIAALALPDMQADDSWISDPEEKGWITKSAGYDNELRMYAVSNLTGEVSIRRVGDGPVNTAEVARLPGFGNEAWVRWGASGRYLAVWHWHAGPHLQVWRLGGESPVAAVEEQAGSLAFGFAPDGRRLVTVSDKLIRVYDLETGTIERSVPAPSGVWEWVAYHPHRAEVALPTQAGVALIRLEDGREVGRLPTQGKIDQVVWHPHGELLAVTFSNRVEVWDVPRRRLNRTLEHPGGGVRASFNPAGDLLSTSGWAARLRLWNPYTGGKVMEAIGYHLFGQDDRLGTTFPDTTVGRASRLTRVEAGRENRTLLAGVGVNGVKDYHCVAVHPGGRLVAVTTGQGLSLIDLATGGERVFIPGYTYAVLFEPSGALLTRTQFGLVRWPVHADRGEPERLTVGPPERVPVALRRGDCNVARSADGSVLAASNWDGAWVWHRDRPRAVVPLRPHDDCRSIAVSPDGKWVATGAWTRFGLKVWDAASGELVQTFLPDRDATVPYFSPDGRWLVNRNGESWRVGDWSAGPKHPGGGAVAFAPDGRLAAWSGGKGYVPLIDPDTGREQARLEDPNQDGLLALTFSPDGTRLFGTTNDSQCVRVWDLRLIRRGLADLGLDWDAPPYPPAPAADAAPARPLQVTVVGQELLADPKNMARYAFDAAVAAAWANPLDSGPRAQIGEMNLNAGRPAMALLHLNIALTLNPDRMDARSLRARSYLLLKQPTAAAADATAVLNQIPGQVAALYTREAAYRQLGRPTEAVADLTQLLKYPHDAELFSERAAAYRALNDPEKAAADLRRADELVRPTTTAVVLNNLARRLVTGPPATRNPKRAQELITQATAARLDDATFLNTLGVIQYRNGLFKEATATLEKSLAAGKGEHDASDLYFLTMCHAKLNDPAKAKDCLARAIRWAEALTVVDAVLAAELKDFRAEAEAAVVGK